ncbi:MAG: MFS transporter [Chitinophagaceae bacterium]
MTLTRQQDRITLYHWLLFLVCFLGTAFAGVTSTLMSVYLPVAVKDLLGNKSETEFNTISAYINSVFLFGAAFGGLLAGILSDKAGRKPALILSIACHALFTLLTGIMPGWQAIVVCRFLSGVGLGAILVTAPTIMTEEWPARSKAIFIGILSIAIPVGIFSAGTIDYFVSSWRQSFYVGLIPLLIAVVSVWLLRESGQWRSENQGRTLHKGASSGIFATEYRSNLVSGTVIFGAMLIGLWAIFLWVPTWISSLITSGDGQKERGISMMMLGAGGLTGGFFSGWLINFAGAKRSMLTCFIVCSALSFLLFKTNHTFSPVIYAEIALLALSFGASQGVLSVYIPALFPVVIRGTATGFCFNIGRFFTAAAVLFVGVLVDTLGGFANSLFIFSWVFVAGLIATFFTKEKKDITWHT